MFSFLIAFTFALLITLARPFVVVLVNAFKVDRMWNDRKAVENIYSLFIVFDNVKNPTGTVFKMKGCLKWL